MTEEVQIPKLTNKADILTANSRFQKSGLEEPHDGLQAPTSAQKWWCAVLLGFIFAILASGISFQTTNSLSLMVGFRTYNEQGPTLAGLLIHTGIFILLMRLILW